MQIKIAIAGNPNCGKTTLFNSLTGSNQYVGNWPGVTVEKKEGKLKNKNDVIITDLPGIYSLSPYTLEEVVARDYLVNERPDAILNIVDGTNLERNLYLTTQLIELGIPVVIAINMMDIVKKHGDKIDTESLSKALGCKIVQISALKSEGIDEAVNLAINAAKENKKSPIHYFSGLIEHALAHIEEATVHHFPEDRQRWYAVKIFERDNKVLEQLNIDKTTLEHIENDIKKVENELDDDAESIIINERYSYITSLASKYFKKKHPNRLSTSDKIDKIVTNRVLAIPIFIVLMFLVYYISIGSVGNWTIGFTETVFERLSELAAAWLASINCAEWLIELITNGIIGGVGAVLGFVPQMLILFFLLAILEDCGYMSRIAFIMDRIFRKFGLSGKSFIPLLVATGCGVPGVMASRTIELERDRRMTIMTTCFIPCGAKMPIVAFIAGALFGGSPLIATASYFIGILSVIISGLMLKKTKAFAGKPAPFVMELPQYHMPIPTNILKTTWERGWSFIKKAGTIILAASVIIWALDSLSISGGIHYIGETKDPSILETIGKAFAWVFAPLGFGNWQSAVATILGLIAKEQVVSTLEVLAQNSQTQITEFLGNSALAGFSFLVFNLLCAPCVAAMGAIRREMNSAKWTLGAIGYMCGFAYAISLIIYQIGAWFIGSGNIIGTVFAGIIIAFMLFMLFRKNPNK